jgi:hypothetical protein
MLKVSLNIRSLLGSIQELQHAIGDHATLAETIEWITSRSAFHLEIEAYEAERFYPALAFLNHGPNMTEPKQLLIQDSEGLSLVVDVQLAHKERVERPLPGMYGDIRVIDKDTNLTLLVFETTKKPVFQLSTDDLRQPRWVNSDLYIHLENVGGMLRFPFEFEWYNLTQEKTYPHESITSREHILRAKTPSAEWQTGDVIQVLDTSTRQVIGQFVVPEKPLPHLVVSGVEWNFMEQGGNFSNVKLLINVRNDGMANMPAHAPLSLYSGDVLIHAATIIIHLGRTRAITLDNTTFADFPDLLNGCQLRLVIFPYIDQMVTVYPFRSAMGD